MSSGRLISIQEACQRADEKPAVIIGWIVHHKIGKHVRTGRVSDWMVDPEALQQFLAQREAAAWAAA